MNRTITITITETWTIVWTATDDPLPPAPVTADEAPNSEGEVPTMQQANPNNTRPDHLTKGLCTKNNPPTLAGIDQQPGELPVGATAAGRRKPVRRRRAQDKQNRPTDESHPILSRPV